jgi:hypothetical protein
MSYHNVKFELQTQLVCGEKKQITIGDTSHQLELVGE